MFLRAPIPLQGLGELHPHHPDWHILNRNQGVRRRKGASESVRGASRGKGEAEGGGVRGGEKTSE